jgi:uncharacterized protein (DUF427 family)
MMVLQRPKPLPIGPGQESVWAYPRPPRLERVPERVRVVFDGEVIADTTRGWRVLETSHPPTYYLPSDDIRPECLVSAGRGSFCEWKGGALYFDVAGPNRTAARAAWSYPDPLPPFAPIADHVAFYVGAMEACFVGDERATPQPGGFYGGWVTSRVVGPFKGEPGTEGW